MELPRGVHIRDEFAISNTNAGPNAGWRLPLGQGCYSRKVVNGSRSCDRSYDHATTPVVIHERNRTYDRSQIRS